MKKLKEEFNLDLTQGFLPVQDPLTKLPNNFAQWDNIANSLSKLLMSNQLRKIIDDMPPFPTDKLSTQHQIERAMLILSFLGHAYVWGDKMTTTTIPASLAKPWYEVATQLGRPPVLSYASYALNNWQKIDKELPVKLGNIALIQNFHGGQDEEWFVLIHVAIEAKIADALQAVLPMLIASKKKDNNTVIEHLQTIVKGLTDICNILDRMVERCDPYIYFNRVRPYIHGWKNNPALPNGLIYEGVAEYENKPQQFRGETGAQSSIIPVMDAVFNIEHQNDLLRAYLQEMRIYMPYEHRDFLEKIESSGGIRHYIINHYKSTPLLRSLYNECIELIARFRSTHFHYATLYIQNQAQVDANNPNAVGTGGTPFMSYLKKHFDETKKFII
jgi:indoleamine 2,3-dioxygenase